MVILVVVFIGLLTYLVYTKLIAPVRYWKKKNILYMNPGTRFYKAFFGSKSFFETICDAYRDYPDHRYYGSYQFFRPSLFVRDIELIKQITTKDFEYFPNHTKFVTGTNDPVIDMNLFSLEGEKWKDMRSTLSPAFTSSKMKAMFLLIQEASNNFTEHFLQQETDIIETEMKTAFSKFTNDVIASCAFGVHCNSLKHDKNEFYMKGSIVANPTAANIVRSVLFALFPKIFVFFRISVFPAQIPKFFKNLVKETIALREKNGIIRPDMIHLLMEARKGQLKHDGSEKIDYDTGYATVEESSLGKSQGKLELTEDVMAAQVLVFFLAGFETSSTLLSFIAYHLAVNPNIQVKLYEEINEVLGAGTTTNVSYEDLLQMKYLDKVVSEALRMYPPGYILTRVCSKDYLIKAKNKDEVDFVLDRGTAVTIPVGGVHRDPHYFPDPDKFDPERFSDENKRKIVSGSYMPFGSGPRNCIGSRFALLECKTLIVNLLHVFEMVPVGKTVIPVKLTKTFNLSVKGGLWLGLKKRGK